MPWCLFTSAPNRVPACGKVGIFFFLTGSDPVGFCDAIGLILMQHKVKSCAVTVWKYCKNDVCGDNHVPLKLPPVEHKSNIQTKTYIYVWILNWCLKSLCTMFFLGGRGSKMSFSIFSRFSFILCCRMVIKTNRSLFITFPVRTFYL